MEKKGVVIKMDYDYEDINIDLDDMEFKDPTRAKFIKGYLKAKI